MSSGFSSAIPRGVAAAAMALAAAMAPSSAALADEADAKALLRAMSDYLAEQKSISFDYDATLEVVTREDQKLGLASSGTVALERPNRIRATRSGGFVDVEMIFDGTTFTLHGETANVYTQIEVPGTIDHLVDELRDTYGRPLPAADLLLSNPYEELMSAVVDVKDLGSGVIDGVECDFLAFRTEEVDWQIWIAHGERPYPCRYVITSKGIAHSPQYTIQVRNWQTGDDVAADDYAFGNATGATKIDLAELGETVSELPQHFSTGDSQ